MDALRRDLLRRDSEVSCVDPSSEKGGPEEALMPMEDIRGILQGFQPQREIVVGEMAEEGLEWDPG